MAEVITSADKIKIKEVMKTDGWDSVVKFFAYKISQWNDEKITGSNEFDTLKNLHTQQGKVGGMEEFMEQLERQAFE
jgi:hypothetical protein